MKVEDVPEEWMALADTVLVPGKPLSKNDLRAALAAVAPMIAKAERERCAGVAETHEWFVGGIGTKAPGSGEAKAIAAAIRALKETKE
jgi:hypothetical protein